MLTHKDRDYRAEVKEEPKKKFKKLDLTPRQLDFCLEYMKTGNATHAYKVAYGNDNVKHCGSSGSIMLKKPHIKEYLDEAQGRLRNKAIWEPEDILKDLKEIAINKDNAVGTRMSAYKLGMAAMGLGQSAAATITNSVSVDANITLAHLSDEELEKLV